MQIKGGKQPTKFKTIPSPKAGPSKGPSGKGMKAAMSAPKMTLWDKKKSEY
jgi:hypothetical protein